MDRGDFVCLVGIDGAGKTTAAQLFVQAQKGRSEYRYVWANVQSWLVHFAVGLFRLLKGSQQAGDAAREYLKARRSPWLRVHYTLLLIDYARHIFVQIALPLWRGRNVVADRYTYDVMVSMGVNLGWSSGRTVKMIDRLLCIFPKPTTLFYLDVPVEVALGRKDDVPSLEYLLVRQAVFEKLVEQYQMVRLDGTKPPKQVVDRMMEVVEVTIHEQS